ncbi:MAG: hypothetical protein II664_05640, partial [Oscillospiraceae bacterium]|nr:hypothetical protein [Oscillospiraceae bacterium]
SFKYLCDYAGINCIVVHGYLYTGTGNGNHAWNVVEYNGKKYHIDVTAELDHAKFHSKADSNSFLKSSRDMHEYRWDNNVVKL